MILIAFLSSAFTHTSAIDPAPPLPPYRREASVRASQGEDPAHCVAGNRFLVADGNACGCYSLPSLKLVWKTRLPNASFVSAVGADEKHVLAMSESEGKRAGTMLAALSLADGRVEWTVPAGSSADTLAVSHGVVYACLKPDTISATQVDTHRTLWTTHLGVAGAVPSRSWIQFMSASPDCLVVSGEPKPADEGVNGVVIGLDPASGKILWQKSHAEPFIRPLAQTAAVWYESDAGVVEVSPKTGETLKSYRTDSFMRLFPGMGCQLIAAEASLVAAYDAGSAGPIWSHAIGDPNEFSTGDTATVLGGRLFALGSYHSVVVGLDGKQLWVGEKGVDLPLPVWTDGRCIVSFDEGKLTRYVQGQEAGIPADPAARRALAAKMLQQFDKLDANERALIVKLGVDAFEPLVRAYLAEYAKPTREMDMTQYGGREALSDMLLKTAKPEVVHLAMHALDGLPTKSEGRKTLIELVAQYGTDEQATPYMIGELRHLDPNSFGNFLETPTIALQRLSVSKDPRAVAFLMHALQDSQSNEEVRYQAYTHLAATGGDAGLKAVLAARHHRTLLRPLTGRAAEALNGKEWGAKLLDKTADNTGRIWGLFTLGILGSHGDLWLAENVKGKWANPLFTGVSTLGLSRWTKPPLPEPTFEGKTAKQLAAGAWKTVLVGNPELAKDSGGSGLTDIEKRRLSLDPARHDSDQDGDNDGVDPWPNAPNRPLTESEQVLAAAFEARYHDREDDAPAIFFAPKEMKPFEMPGRKNVTIWVSGPENGKDEWKLPLAQCYQQGVCFISVRGIQWGSDHRSAVVTISTYYGGLDGTGYSIQLRKFGNDWVVVGTHMEWIS